MPTFEERRNRAGQVITLRVKIRRRGFPEVGRSFDVNGADLAVFRDDQLQRVGPASVQRDLAILSHVFNVARREWGMENLSNPLQVVRKPKLPNGRQRRVSEEEIEAIVEASESPHLAALVRLAVESAMRRGELVAVRWENVNLDKQWLWLPDTKHNTGRHVPLSKKAVRLLRKVREAAGTAPKGLVFPMQPDSVSRAFARAVNRARRHLAGDARRASNGHQRWRTCASTIYVTRPRVGCSTVAFIRSRPRR